MIKRIDKSDLRIGMYVHNLECSWADNPFFETSFPISNERVLRQLRESRIQSLQIDTDKGLDLPGAPHRSPNSSVVTSPGPSRPSVPATAEFSQSRAVFSKATTIIKGLMHDIRLGKQVQLANLQPVTDSLVQAAFRNHYAFSGISRLKSKDEYTFMHSVSVAGLLVAFGRDLGMDDDALHELALGGLLHDIGKSMTPNHILNKPGKLDPDEFEIMKRHVIHSGEIIKGIDDLGQVPTDVTLLHHEKIDGSGYPKGLKGDEISEVGKMSAIVDIYDALTSERIYKSAWQPTISLKSMMEWSPANLSRELVECFVRCLGIYPVGSTVQLTSGLIAVVIDQTDDLLRPLLRLAFHAGKNRPVAVRDVDMTRELLEDRVEHIVDPAKFGINPNLFLNAQARIA